MKRRVLLADDDAALRRLIGTTLGTDDFELLQAVDGEEALRIARNERPELVLLDVNLPGIDGLTLCAELVRSRPELSVILLTGEDVGPTTARLAGAKGVVRASGAGGIYGGRDVVILAAEFGARR